MSSVREGRRALCAGNTSSSRRKIWRRLADQRDLGLCDTRGLVRIGVDPDDSQIAVDAPVQQRHVQMGADRKHRIGFRPEFVAERQID